MQRIECGSFVARPCTVSTMTISGKLNLPRVCRVQLGVAVEWTNNSKMKMGGIPGHRAFNNQTTVTVESKSVKIFHNGSVHVAGCKSARDFQRALGIVCESLNQAGIVPPPGSGSVEVRLIAVNIDMINISFSVSCHLGLVDLLQHALRLGWVAYYDADVYPGLKIKIPTHCGDRPVTALMFKSGRIILAGAKSPQASRAAHEALLSLIRHHRENPTGPLASLGSTGTMNG